MKRSPPRYLDSPLSFEQWLRRPVYVVQCVTYRMACDMGYVGVGFRTMPGYRDEVSLAVRSLVARAVWADRPAFRRAVQCWKAK